MTKSDFNFITEALLIFKVSFSMSKDKADFKIYDVTAWETVKIHILPNISRSKGSQTMKDGQLKAYSKINIFLQK